MCTHPAMRSFYGLRQQRTAILVIGGHRRHAAGFCDEYVMRADAIYDEYPRESECERQQERDRTEGAIRTTGHHSWERLMRERHTEKERGRIRGTV